MAIAGGITPRSGFGLHCLLFIVHIVHEMHAWILMLDEYLTPVTCNSPSRFTFVQALHCVNSNLPAVEDQFVC